MVGNTEFVETAIPMDREGRPKKEFTTAEAVISVVCLALGCMFAHFVRGYVGGLWGGIFWMLTGIVGAVYVRYKGIQVLKGQKAVFFIAELFCLTPLFCANMGINILATVFSFLLFGYLAFSLRRGNMFGKNFVSDLAESVLVQPFSCYPDAKDAAAKLVKDPKLGRNILYVVLGLIISIPLSVVVLYLLMSSDGRFSDLVIRVGQYLPGFHIRYVFEFGFGILVWMYLFGGLSAMENTKEEPWFEAGKKKFLPPALGYAAATPVCIFYVAYIAVQFQYFTSAFLGTLPEEYSYSSYARNGFFELCIIAVINLGVLLVMELFIKQPEGNRSVVLKVYNTVLASVTLLLIASALSKMVLYILEMGMTPLRIYTSWFMLVLAAVFVTIIVSQYVTFSFWKTVFVCFTILFGMLCFSNVDGMIARYNVTAYEEGRLADVDFKVLEELGDVALVYVERLANAEHGVISEEAEMQYRDMLRNTDAKMEFAYFSIPRAIGRGGK